VTGRAFPLLHWSAIDYRRPEDEGAIRRLWYLARHLELPELALPYYMKGDAAAAERVAGLIRSWIEQCPPRRGIHWLVPLELALRLTAWSYAARLLEGSGALARLAPALAAAVHLQAEHILGHLARYSSANNHLIAQATGLVHAGAAFTGLRRAEHWRRTGSEILWREILLQTTKDGVSREASTHYHELVLELALGAWLVLRAGGEEPPARVRERLGAMLDFLAELEAFPGGAPDLGDSDNQSALPLRDPRPPRPALLALGAVLFGRGDWKELAGGLPRRAAFLLGEGGRAAYAGLAPARRAAASRLYREAGYAILRDAAGERALLLDFGELGHLATAAHGHADCLSIVLGAFEEPLLVDPGTYTYHAEPALRDFFRSTAAHNTVRVDGEEQSEMLGPFLWGRRAHGRLVEWASLPAVDLVMAEHDGYERLRAPVTHRRAVVFVKPDYFWVMDGFAGRGEHRLELLLHLGEGSVSRGPGPGEVLARTRSGAALRVLILLDPAPELDVVSGCAEPLQGWISSAFGERRVAPVIRWVATRSMPAILSFLLRPLAAAPAGRDAAAGGGETAEVVAYENGSALHVRGMPGEDLVLLGSGAGRLPGPGSLAGEFELEGRLALVRSGAGGEGSLVIAGRGLKRLKVGGRVLVEVEEELGRAGGADFCFRRQGDRAVVEGRGGRLRVLGHGIREVEDGGAPLAVDRVGDWLAFTLTSPPAGRSSPAGGPPVL
jgi:hypothetical protein